MRNRNKIRISAVIAAVFITTSCGEPFFADNTAESGSGQTEASLTAVTPTDAAEPASAETPEPAAETPTITDPVTEAAETLDPATEASETLDPVTEASETLDPVTETAETPEPATEAYEILEPETEKTETLSAGTEQSETMISETVSETSVPEQSEEPMSENMETTEAASSAENTTGTEENIPSGTDETESELLLSPAFFAQLQSGDVIISVTADEGVLPEGTVVAVSEKKDDPDAPDEDKMSARKADAIVSMLSDCDERPVQQYVYDISLIDAEGNEVQPDTSGGNIYVSFTTESIGDQNTDAEVYHLPDEIMESDTVSEEEAYEAADVLDITEDLHEENTVTVQTQGFSIYVLRLMAAGQGTLSITKYWDDAGYESRRPETLTIDIYEPGGTKLAKTVTMTSGNAVTGSRWTCDTGLARYDSGGDEIQYVIKERSPGDGYLTLYNSESGFAITFADDARYASSTYGLYLFYEDADGNIYEYNGQDGKKTNGGGLVEPYNGTQADLAGARILLTEENWIPYTGSSFSSWLSNKIGRTPRQEIEEKTGTDYPWSRQNAPVGEDHVWHYSIGSGQSFYLVQDGASWSGSYIHISNIEPYGAKNVITNKWNQTGITVSKTWDDDGAEASRPGAVTMYIYDSDNMNTSVGSVTVTSGEGWKKSVTGLPKYHQDGTEIRYSVKEQAIDGYSTSYSSDSFNGLAVHFSEDTAANAFIFFYDEQAGSWKEARYGAGTYGAANGGEGISLKNETVYLRSMDFYVLPYSGHIAIDSITPVHLNKEPRTGSYSPYMAGLSVEEAGGADLLNKDITNGYEGSSPYYCWHYSYTGAVNPAADALTVTNSAVSVDITKTWRDDGYENLRRTVAVKIYSDSELTSLAKTVTLTARDTAGENIWKKTAAPLPGYDRSGKKITYTAVEEAPRDYTVTYNAEAGTGSGLKIKFGNVVSGQGSTAIVYRIGDDIYYRNYYSIQSGSEIAVPGTEVWISTMSTYNIARIEYVNSFNPGTEYYQYKGFPITSYTYDEYSDTNYPHRDTSSSNYHAHYKMTQSPVPVIGGASIINTIIPKRFYVNKYNISGTEEIEGAVIAIYESSDINADGSVKSGAAAVGSWTSKKGESHDFGPELNSGKSYVLVETAAPTGYGKVTNIPFSVSDTGMVICGLERDSTGSYMVKDEILKNSLKISKNVTGSMGSKTKEFAFTVSFASGLEPLTSVVWAKSDGTSGTGTLSDGGYNFTLSHGQSITFNGIPFGTKCKVTEDSYADEGYITLIDGDISKKHFKELTISGKDISTAFENRNEGVVPTSVHSGAGQLRAVYVFICAGIIYLSLRHRRKKKKG